MTTTSDDDLQTALLFRQLVIPWIALPFSPTFGQTAIVCLKAPSVYTFAQYLEVLRGARLEFFTEADATKPKYTCQIDHQRHTKERVGTGMFGLATSPLPAFADLPPGTKVVLRNRYGKMRTFSFDKLRKTG